MRDDGPRELRPGDMEKLPPGWIRSNVGNAFRPTTLPARDEQYETAAVTVFLGKPKTRNAGKYAWVLDGSFSRKAFATEEEAIEDAEETHGPIFADVEEDDVSSSMHEEEA